MLRLCCVILSLVLLSACEDSATSPLKSAPMPVSQPVSRPISGPLPGRAPSLEGSKWFLQYLRPAGTDELQQVPLNAPFSLQLQSDRGISGYAGCNAFTGEYSYLNDAIQISILGMDAAACAGQDVAVIGNVVDLLHDAAWFDMTKHTLTLETYGDWQLVFEPQFGGCSAPQNVTGDSSSSAVVIVGRDAEETAELVAEYQVVHPDFTLQENSEEVVARMSDNTLQRLRCDARVISLRYKS